MGYEAAYQDARDSLERQLRLLAQLDDKAASLARAATAVLGLSGAAIVGLQSGRVSLPAMMLLGVGLGFLFGSVVILARAALKRVRILGVDPSGYLRVAGELWDKTKFHRAMLLSYADALERNAKEMSRMARLLRWSYWVFAVGILLAAVSVALLLDLPHGGP